MTHEIQKELENLAARYDGWEYGDDVTNEEEAKLKDRGIVMVFGASDDLVELRGAIDSEAGAYEGATLFFHNGKLLENECEDEKCPYFKELQMQNHSKFVEALWCVNGDESEYSWTFETDIPHVTFDIYEDGEKYCRGILFYVEMLQQEDQK